ncbi:gliding motility-associated peptidyl-prolyl isomerase GldI [Paucihalobacter ruber]|uniref:Peptidyl-prolyl cis-trans isomerase n=1 Tax=Paucihalobacter ruber TaxID=2567861 RepID=A0A506PII1_9FLAO|nr:gliding motility-associated peptidyl-prolyl isomerase GldI [Paucihalobacter ruber]TPV32887.1 gliding motility-associated peptidyl-prolyl isomerase GldI [Paucihalobacter ruber]
MKLFVYNLLIVILAFGCKSPEAREPISTASGSFIKESAERNIQLNKQQEAAFKDLMATMPETDFIASPNGFWYYYNNKIETDTITAKFGDLINYNYDIKDINGNMIYAEDEVSPKTYAMDQQELFTGLREGLKIMKPGETVTFYFPSNLAYGYYGDQKRIGINTPIICEVTVNNIKQTNHD